MTKISLKKAIWIILGSLILISGGTYFAYFYYRHLQGTLFLDPRYNIVAIVQKTSSKEPLKTAYFAELLDLSQDKPKNFFDFSLIKAKKKIEQLPHIKKVFVAKILPGTLLIDYELREPCCLLGEICNTACDKEGRMFPMHPFFTPKSLPKIYLGIAKDQIDDRFFEKQIKSPKLDLVFSIIEKFRSENNVFFLSVIDVSKAEATSYGKREVIIGIKDKKERAFFLKLFPLYWKEGLMSFFSLYPKWVWEEKNHVIDLRLKQLAYVYPYGDDELFKF